MQVDFRKHLPALDGLRGMAILTVFFYHYAGGLQNTAGSGALHALGMVFAFGWSGVDLFFVLSGFLITGILYDTKTSAGYYKNFYARRILRIFPIYYLFLLIYLLLTPFIGAQWKLGQLSFLVYLGFPAVLIWPALGQVSPLVRINHLWSVNAEEQFYMIWPWMISKLRTSKAILRACVVVGSMAFLLRVAISVSGRVSMAWTHDFLLCRMDAIALGAAIAILVRGPLQERMLKWAPAAFVVAVSAVVGLCVARHTVDHADPAIATAGLSLIALAFGALLLLALRQGGWIDSLFSVRILRIFGKYSYGMYLYDFPLTLLLRPRREFFIVRMHSYAVGSVVFLVFCLAVNLLIAALSFHFIESPIMRLKSRFKYT